MKILVGYDGSKTAMDALKLARKHAKALNATVYVVTSMVGREREGVEKVEQAEKALDFAREVLAESGVPCETHLLIRGLEPGEDIIQYAKEHDIDEIYIGVKRRSNLSKIVFGSNARNIIIEAHCPVMTVK